MVLVRVTVKIISRVEKMSHLYLYMPNQPIIVSADISSYWIGAIIRQRQPDGKVRSVTYVSRLLTNTEQQYVQIEKKLRMKLMRFKYTISHVSGKELVTAYAYCLSRN